MLNPNPGQESFEDQFMDLLRSYELIMEESRYHPNVIVEAEAFSKFVNDILSAYQATTDQRVTEARIEENQLYLDRIEAWKNRVPVPGEVTAASFGRGGAGMVESAYEQAFRDRIAILTQKEGNNGR